MTDQQLLQLAVEDLHAATYSDKLDDKGAEFYINRSIASSLLIIARNSDPTRRRKDNLSQFDQPEGTAIPSLEDFTATRLADYTKYWNEVTRRYNIADDWNPTHEELLDDIKRGYEFEFEVSE